MRQGDVYLLRQRRTLAQRSRGEPRREQQVLIISSTAFNDLRDAPVVWGIPGDEDRYDDSLWGILVEPSGMVHPHIVMTRTRDEVRQTGMEIPTDGVRRNVDIILRKILGVEP